MKWLLASIVLSCAMAPAVGIAIGFGDGDEEGCKRPDEPLQTIYDNADYNSELVQMVVLSIISSLWSIIVVYFHLTNPPHVKNCLLWDKIISIRLHVTSGVTEIVTAHIAWFADDHDIWAQVMAVASVVHLCTAMYQTPDVFGIKALMIPAYMICIILRFWTTFDLFLNPTCYMKIIREYICLSIYTWCRLYFVVFATMKIFEHNRYTISIILAGFTCAPACGPAFNLGIAIFAFGYLTLVGFCFSAENKAWQLTETSGSMFKNPTFRGFLMAVKHLPLPEGADESDSPEEKVARMLFNQFDTDKDGSLDYYEMKNLGATFSSGVIHEKVENYLNRFPDTKTEGLSFDAFRQMLFPGSNSFHIDLNTYNACKTDEQKARLIFDGVRAAGGMAREHVSIEELQSLFIEWGVPRREAVRMFKQADSDNDGKVTFEEWQKHMKPVWKYQFKELRGTLLEVEHIEHRNEILSGFEKSQLPEKSTHANKGAHESKAIAQVKEQARELAELKAQLASLSASLASKGAPPVAPKPVTTHISSEI